MTPAPRRRTGFTLVELLVVIAILGILVALLVPAVMSATRRARQAQAESQVNTLAAALASFKTKYGEYPPSRLVFHESGRLGTPPTAGATAGIGTYFSGFASQYPNIGGQNTGPAPATGFTEFSELVNRSMTALRSLFPKMNVDGSSFTGTPTSKAPPPPPPATGAGYYDINGNGVADVEPILLDGHECLYLFLCGVPDWETTASSASLRGAGGFHVSPRNPFQAVPPQGPDASRTTPFFEIASPSHLVDDDKDGVPGIVDPIATGDTARYVAYFSSTFGGYDPRDVRLALPDPATGLPVAAQWTIPGAGTGPVLAPNPWTTSNPATGVPRYHRPQSFQLLSPGSDRLYGPGGMVVNQDGALTFPGADRNAEEDNVGME